MACQFDEDEYRNQQLNKYLDEGDMSDPVSSCCGVPIIENTDLCSDCQEHCSEVEIGAFMHDKHVAYMEDVADAEHEIQRDKDDQFS